METPGPGASKLEWALYNVRRGFRVFPCGTDGKPMVNRFYERATTDERVIRLWWEKRPNANPAISTDGLIVLDADVKKGKRGLETLAALDLPETYSVTTPSGGQHDYYIGDARNSVEQLGPGLDVRGHHGYVLAAGAVGSNGVPYRPASDLGAVAAPAALIARLNEGRRAPDGGDAVPGTASPTVVLDTDAALARATYWLTNEAAPAVEGLGGDAATFRVAANLKDMGVSEFAAWDLMVEYWNDRCSPPWSLEALEEKVRNAYLYGTRAPGADSPEVNFAGVDILPPPRVGWDWSYHGEAPVLEGNWLLHEMLPAVGTLLVVGPSGAGKTFLLTHLSQAVASGQPFFGVTPEERGAVLMIFAGTEGAGIENRLAAAGEQKPRLPIAHTSGVYLRQAAAVTSLAAELREQAKTMLEAFGVPLRLVVLETISASGLVEKENDSDSVTAALLVLGRIATELGILFATSHHPPKDGEGARGSGAFKAMVDSMIEVVREGREPIRTVELQKARNAPERTLGSFSLAPVELGHDSRGRPVVSMKLTSSTELAPSRSEDIRARLLEILKADAARYGDVLPTGEKGLALADLRSTFNDALPGMDKANRSRALKRALADLQDLGVVAMVRHEGKDLFYVKEVVL